jgi:hypothetical protein
MRLYDTALRQAHWLRVRRRTDRPVIRGHALSMIEPNQTALLPAARPILNDQKAEFTDEGASSPGITGLDMPRGAHPTSQIVDVPQRRKVLTLKAPTAPI